MPTLQKRTVGDEGQHWGEGQEGEGGGPDVLSLYVPHLQLMKVLPGDLEGKA